jgi:hypothetical protein
VCAKRAAADDDDDAAIDTASNIRLLLLQLCNLHWVKLPLIPAQPLMLMLLLIIAGCGCGCS